MLFYFKSIYYSELNIINLDTFLAVTIHPYGIKAKIEWDFYHQVIHYYEFVACIRP